MSTQIETWFPASTFGSRLVLLRRELGLSTKEAASKAGLHYATWSTWENGRTPSNQAAVVSSIADAYGVDRAWLMWGVASPDSHDGHPAEPTGLQHAAHDLDWVPVSWSVAA